VCAAQCEVALGIGAEALRTEPAFVIAHDLAAFGAVLQVGRDRRLRHRPEAIRSAERFGNMERGYCRSVLVARPFNPLFPGAKRGGRAFGSLWLGRFLRKPVFSPFFRLFLFDLAECLG